MKRDVNAEAASPELLHASSPPANSRSTLLALAAILLLTAAASLYLSSQKLFWQDELFEFFSDARPTLRAVIVGQRDFPFSLEPPAFHLLLHAMQRLPLRPEISTRLPSLVALLITELCAFLLTLRLARSRVAALLAAALPMVLVTMEYSAEARVYSLLTATYALAFVCYQHTLSTNSRRRVLASAGLCLCLSAGILLHYFGLLLPLPFLLAEIIRLLRSPRDRYLAPIVAVLLSFAAFILNLPFLAGLREIQSKYFNSGEARWDMAALTYLWDILRSRIYNIRRLHGPRPVLFTALVAGLLLTSLWLLWRNRSLSATPAAQSPLLLALSAGLFLPLLNLTLGIVRSHAYTPRYSLPVVVPIVVLASVLASPLLRRPALGCVLVTLVALGGVVRTLHEARQLRRERLSFLAALQPSPTLLSALASTTDPHLYLQDPTNFLPVYFYAPSLLQARLVNLQSVPLEEHWFHSAAASLFARNMAASTTVPVTTYEQLHARAQPFLLVLFGTGAEWITQQLPADHATVTTLGPIFFGGTLLRVYPAPSSVHPERPASPAPATPY